MFRPYDDFFPFDVEIWRQRKKWNPIDTGREKGQSVTLKDYQSQRCVNRRRSRSIGSFADQDTYALSADQDRLCNPGDRDGSAGHGDEPIQYRVLPCLERREKCERSLGLGPRLVSRSTSIIYRSGT